MRSEKFDHESEDLAELFYRNKAKWHKSCHLKFAASKLTKIIQKCESTTSNDQRRSKRQSNSLSDEAHCIFCLQTSCKLATTVYSNGIRL